MAHLISTATGAQAYVTLAENLLRKGKLVSPRGLECMEIEDCTVHIDRAADAVPLGTPRKVNLKIGATEYAQLLAGTSFLEQLDLASGGNFTQFADDGRLLGAYGPRVFSQLQGCAAHLAADPDTRQAVVVIGRGIASDALRGQHDVPCTTCVQFRIRNGKLNATVTMRSSDFWLGIPYDWWMQSRLQLTLAWSLGIEAGTFTWQAGSQHLYTKNIAGATEVAICDIQSSEQPPFLYGDGGNTVEENMKTAQDCASWVVLDQPVYNDAALWHGVYVPQPEVSNGRSCWAICPNCRYVTETEDMIATEIPCRVCVGSPAWRHG